MEPTATIGYSTEAFSDSLLAGLYEGSYWAISTDVNDYPTHTVGYQGKALARICAIRTDLDRFSDLEQLILMNHGWALTDAALRSHVPKAMLPNPLPPGTAPDVGLLGAPARVIEALRESDKTNIFGH